jgi:hypothetical protein
MESTSEDEPMPDRVRRRVLWIALLLLALVPFVVIDGPGAAVLTRLGLVDDDEPFTELFLVDRAQLPDELAAGAPIIFDFAIRNNEGEATTYEWQVRFESPGSAPDGQTSTAVASRTILDSGELRLDDHEESSVHVEAVAPDAVGPATIRVVLAGRDEAIQVPVVVTGG